MDKAEEKNIYQKLVDEYGQKSRMVKTIEELGELIVAISQYEFGKLDELSKNKVTIRHIAEEISDVEIMMAQMRIIIGKELVDECKQKKLDELRTMLEIKIRSRFVFQQ